MRRSKNDTLERLRRLIERRLGRPVDDDVWEWMVRRGKLALYEDMGEAELDEHMGDVVEEYLEYEEVARLGQRPLRGLPLERIEGLRGVGEGEATRSALVARAEAFSRFIATLARSEPGVVRYRREVLRGRTLSEEEALRFVESPVLAVVPWEYLKDLPCALWEVEGQVWEEDGKTVIELTWPVRRRYWFPWNLRSPVLCYPRRGQEAWVWVDSVSVLGDLRALASWLAQVYPWRESQATWFVLTDTPPLVSPVRWRPGGRLTGLFTRPVIELEVEPWWPARRLAETYRLIQRQLGITRSVGEKASTLISFLADHVRVRHPPESGMNSVLELPPWRRLMALWNEAHPDQRYQDVRRFARDCQAALERVVFQREVAARCVKLWYG
jgi:hypothetical protein